jgi:hypothetical protein
VFITYAALLVVGVILLVADLFIGAVLVPNWISKKILVHLVRISAPDVPRSFGTAAPCPFHPAATARHPCLGRP